MSRSFKNFNAPVPPLAFIKLAKSVTPFGVAFVICLINVPSTSVLIILSISRENTADLNMLSLIVLRVFKNLAPFIIKP